MTRPRILLTNDDGIHAPGIKYLYDALSPFYDLTISAPLVQKSGASISTSLTKPLQIHEISWHGGVRAHRINGTPSDCVKLALSQIMDKVPDLIVSGINQGSNAGRNVLYSGTIGAVIEGVFRNIPGVAFSCYDLKDPDFEKAKNYIHPIVEYLLKNPLNEGSFLNVNFPPKELEIKGLKMAFQGRGYSTDNPDKRRHPEGHYYYWIGGRWNEHKEEDNSDVKLLRDGYITAVPINISQLTCEKQFQKHQDSLEKIFS